MINNKKVIFLNREAKETNGIFKLISWKQNDVTMLWQKRKTTKRQITVHNTYQHRQLQTEQHEHHQIPGVIYSCSI